MSKIRLWRVDTSHIRGYCAPQMFIETENERLCNAEVEALNLAKQSSRFCDLPEWTLEVTQVNKQKFNGKWYSPEECEYKKGVTYD